ncbi:MAG TPA: glycosyltransferase, partial [Thermoanaerobaculia bacterium]|nr:glycosyltransferase [Thermoanaerobaculia bacterium]
DLTCAVVHWNMPELLAGCLASLLGETARLRASGMDAEVVVVDSGSRAEVRARLRASLPPEVTLVESEENLGYPRACNLAYGRSAAPLFLLSNADVVYLPGALAALVAALAARPGAALAGPASWWDRERTLLLNPGFPEDRERIAEDAAAARAGAWPDHALAWQRRMEAAAFAREPVELAILSGACMLVRRERIEAAGGLFDPALFLYYEDTDLCRRLRDRGLPILYEPRAEIVHLFNQSRAPEAAERMAASRRYFLARHYGAGEAERLLALAAESVPGQSDFAAWDLRDLGPCDRPPVFAWQSEGASLFALGLNPQIVPAAMAGRERPEIALSAPFWEQLAPGDYWARATDPSAERVLGYWKFTRP